MSEPTAIVCNLERFATHDGPGIRTLVFMKGCPMKCVWCSSPHTQKKNPQVLFHAARCRKDQNCITECPEGAIVVTDTTLHIDPMKCNACGDCVEICNQRAFELMGQTMTVDQLVKEIEKDSSFYRRSNGGVTIGGGELTMQWEYVTAVLKKCKEQYIHTAIETCGYTKWEYMRSVLEHVDLLFMDLKHMDDARHRQLTGVPNKLVHDNARQAAAMRETIFRIPVIPGINDDDENIIETARFVSELGDRVLRIELLPYHQLGMHRYEQIGKEYQLIDVETPPDEEMYRLRDLVVAEGVAAEIVA